MGCLQSLLTSTFNENYNNNTCVICWSASSNVIVIPCGHHQICESCALHLRRRNHREVIISQETNIFFKHITCPICFHASGVIKTFPNRTEREYQCSVCKKNSEINCLIIPCCNFSVCYECCLNFETNQGENHISLSTDFSIVCPVCRREGTMITLS